MQQFLFCTIVLAEVILVLSYHNASMMKELMWWTTPQNSEILSEMKRNVDARPCSKSCLLAALEASNTHIYAITGNSALRRQNLRDFAVSLGLTATDEAVEGDQQFIRNEHFSMVAALSRPGGTSPHDGAFPRMGRWRRGRYLCQQSHAHAMSLLLQSDHSNALVLEDDVTVMGGVDAAAARAVLRDALLLPAGTWDLNYLGYCYALNSNGFKYTDSGSGGGAGSDPRAHSLFVHSHAALCTHAYLVTREAAATMVRSSHKLFTAQKEGVDRFFAKLNCVRGE